VVLTKLAAPAVSAGEIGPVSHDHHADNLDAGGRELLARAGCVLTTNAGAGRLGAGATSLDPGDTVDLDLPDGGRVSVTTLGPG
jgi:hypothetical protein